MTGATVESLGGQPLRYTDSGISFAAPTSTGARSYITYDQSRGCGVLSDGRLLPMEPVDLAGVAASPEFHVVLKCSRS